MSYSIGTSKFHVGTAMERQNRRVRAELYISGENAKSWYQELKEDAEAIHSQLGFQLDWQFLPEGTDCRIAVFLNEVNPDNHDDWKRQHEWLADRANKIHAVFSERVKALKSV
jgi:transcriptional regulator GlxA family with amidase domain